MKAAFIVARLAALWGSSMAATLSEQGQAGVEESAKANAGQARYAFAADLIDQLTDALAQDVENLFEQGKTIEDIKAARMGDSGYVISSLGGLDEAINGFLGPDGGLGRRDENLDVGKLAGGLPISRLLAGVMNTEADAKGGGKKEGKKGGKEGKGKGKGKDKDKDKKKDKKKDEDDGGKGDKGDKGSNKGAYGLGKKKGGGDKGPKGGDYGERPDKGDNDKGGKKGGYGGDDDDGGKKGGYGGGGDDGGKKKDPLGMILKKIKSPKVQAALKKAARKGPNFLAVLFPVTSLVKKLGLGSLFPLTIIVDALLLALLGLGPVVGKLLLNLGLIGHKEKKN
ncbi:hypothetical protein HIM_06233 [Hirsutella minnesotensis 3608]|uniref:Uncharacterized protein n=1 Tax=Hirsutella minnesotensis 3608 TaxID=1043627 RepID=A0A0F7ZU85_9HYPO|nr:hypothetical protein HIM_06233 [Hirsutella minnesotensis 3608]